MHLRIRSYKGVWQLCVQAVLNGETFVHTVSFEELPKPAILCIGLVRRC
jgi:hypothetical protein